MRYAPAAPEAPLTINRSAQKVKKIEGRATVHDPAGGSNSVIVLRVEFCDQDGRVVDQRQIGASASDPGDEVVFSIETNVDLQPNSRWSFFFDNPGQFDLDKTAMLINAVMRLQVSSGEDDETLEIPFGAVSVRTDSPAIFNRALRVRSEVSQGSAGQSEERTGGQSESERLELARTLAQLNAKRELYRLAIDLQQGPVERFVILSQRAGSCEMPIDMQPVGCAGEHLAFLVRGELGVIPPDGKEPIQQLVSTAAGATFLEPLRGRNELVEEAIRKDWPSLVIPSNSSIEWPPPVQLTAASADLPSDGSGDLKKPSTATPPTAADVLLKLADIDEMIKQINDQLESQRKSVPKPPNGTGEGEGEGEAGRGSADA
jgi:hypothetical protein